SRQSKRIAITDNLFDGIDKSPWGGDGYFLQITDRPREVTIDHNTIVQGESNGLIKMDGLVERFVFTNNIAGHGAYGIIGSDHAIGNDSTRTFMPDAVITANVIAGGSGRVFPAGNLFPTVAELRA